MFPSYTLILPSATAVLKARAMATRPFWSEYRILACDPTTSLFSPAPLIQRMLSSYCWRTFGGAGYEKFSFIYLLKRIYMQEVFMDVVSQCPYAEVYDDVLYLLPPLAKRTGFWWTAKIMWKGCKVRLLLVPYSICSLWEKIINAFRCEYHSYNFALYLWGRFKNGDGCICD